MDTAVDLGSSLIVEYFEESHRPERSLTFGRVADLVLDSSNRYLHRIAGRFRHRSSGWWIENVGSTLPFSVATASGLHAELTPKNRMRLPGSLGTVRIIGGPTTYEFGYWQSAWTDDDTTLTGPHPSTGDTTERYGVRLAPREIDFLVTLGQNRLRGVFGPIPTRAEVGQVWGVTGATVGKTLENLRTKMREKGVRFVESPEMLVEHAVINGLITFYDVQWAFDGPKGPRSASTRI